MNEAIKRSEKLYLTNIEELERVVKITSRCRFIAARRYEIQNRVAQWTIAAISVCLIVISILQSTGMTTKYSAKTLNFMQLSFSISVLVFSLLINSENYGLKAEKMNRCGLDLRRLLLDIQATSHKNDSEEEYKNMCERYHLILGGYDNHDDLDYEICKIKHPNLFNNADGIEKNPLSNYKYTLMQIKIQIGYLFVFFPFVSALSIIAFVLWELVN